MFLAQFNPTWRDKINCLVIHVLILHSPLAGC